MRKKVCPQCDGIYDDESLIHCPDDGAKLFLVDYGPDLVGREIEGRFRIDEKLAQGGSSIIYKAFQYSMDREVALKILVKDLATDDIMIRRFFQEAKQASKLENPNIITLYDFGQTTDGLLYIAMELLKGRSLAELIALEAPLPYKRVCHIISQVCNALAEAHENGIIHRDLKPLNIHIEKRKGFNDFVKVLDFGIAKQLDEAGSSLTKTGNITGTPYYMSPEQINEGKIGNQSDIYALGVILYEMLCGTTPFHTGSSMSILIKHIQTIPPPLSKQNPAVQVPEDLEDLVMECLAKELQQRPRNVEILKQRLDSFLQGNGELTRESSREDEVSSLGSDDPTSVISLEKLTELKKSASQPRERGSDSAPVELAALDLSHPSVESSGEVTAERASSENRYNHYTGNEQPDVPADAESADEHGDESGPEHTWSASRSKPKMAARNRSLREPLLKSSDRFGRVPDRLNRSSERTRLEALPEQDEKELSDLDSFDELDDGVRGAARKGSPRRVTGRKQDIIVTEEMIDNWSKLPTRIVSEPLEQRYSPPEPRISPERTPIDLSEEEGKDYYFWIQVILGVAILLLVIFISYLFVS